jgi:Uncharacterized protein encoded in hypervariable junctions of pilus gene clusters
MFQKVDPKSYPCKISLQSSGGETLYQVSFNDFPNVIGGGATAAEALDEAYGNLDAIIDDMEKHQEPVPNPTIIDMDHLPSGKITLRMSRSLHAALIERAESEDMSINSIVIEALSEYLFQKRLFDPSDTIKTQELLDKIAVAFSSLKKLEDRPVPSSYSQKSSKGRPLNQK